MSEPNVQLQWVARDKFLSRCSAADVFGCRISVVSTRRAV